MTRTASRTLLAVWLFAAGAPFDVALLVLGVLLVGRRAAVRRRAPLVPVARPPCSCWPGSRSATGGLEVIQLDPRVRLRARPGHRRADRDPVPRRARGRGRDAAARVAPAAAQARARDADHLRRSSPWPRTPLTDLGWTECFLLGAILSPTDPVLSSERRHQPARAAARAPLAQPRVRAQRRPRAAGRARLRRRRCGAARATSCGGSSCSRTSTLGFAFGVVIGLVASRLLPPRPGMPAPAVAVRARHRVRDLRRHRRLPPRGQRPDRGVRLRDHARHPAARPARAVRGSARTTSSRSSSSACSSSSARCSPSAGCSATAGRRWRWWRVTLLVARPVAIWIALLGTRTRRDWRRVHGLVRPQGRGHDDLLAARARPSRSRRRADLQPRGAVRVRVDPRPRAHRHTGRELARAPSGGSATRAERPVPAR